MDQRDQVLSATDVERICDHMNAEHTDDLLRFARVYGEVPPATSARMTGIDAEGMTLEVNVGEGTQAVRIDFKEPLNTPDDARKTLVDMAVRAREESV
ncbi:MAG: DUF2470 domain-containing protein [Salinivenus sp.]